MKESDLIFVVHIDFVSLHKDAFPAEGITIHQMVT